MFCILSSNAVAKAREDRYVTTGKTYHLNISVCASKQSALNVVEATNTLGGDFSQKVWDTSSTCGNSELIFTVGDIVQREKSKDIANTEQVVEIINPYEKNQKLYWIATVGIMPAIVNPKHESPRISEPGVSQEA